MNFKDTPKNVTVLGRRQRFIADVEDAEGNVLPAYLSNNTTMTGVLEKGKTKGMITTRPRNRRIPFTLEMVYSKGTLIGVNHGNTMKLVSEALKEEKLAELIGYSKISNVPEYKDSALLLENDTGDKCLVLVKDIYLKKAATLVYPDGIYPAETRVIEQAAQLLAKKHRVVILLVAQRNDAIDARLGWETDGEYAETLSAALKQGVEVLCYNCQLSLKGITLKDRMDFKV